MLNGELHYDFGIATGGSVLDDALSTDVDGSENYASIGTVRNDCPLVIGLYFLAVVIDVHFTGLLDAIAPEHIIKFEIGIAPRGSVELFADICEAR